MNSNCQSRNQAHNSIDRYNKCVFCDRTSDLGFTCAICRPGFEKWVKENTNIRATNIFDNTEMEAYSMNPTKKPNLRKIYPRTPLNQWPGFYFGNNMWMIPLFHQNILFRKNEDEITFDDCADSLLQLLEENGIDLYKEVQCNF